MVQHDVARDPKQPSRQLILGRHRDGHPADPQKHLLRQIPGEFGFPAGTAEIPAEPVLLEGEERRSVGHGRHGQLLSGTLGRPNPLKVSRRRDSRSQTSRTPDPTQSRLPREVWCATLRAPLRDPIGKRAAAKRARSQSLTARPLSRLVASLGNVRNTLQELTDDAARVAATKRGGWRGSVTLSCASKVTVSKRLRRTPSLASLSTPPTCKLRVPTNSAAFRAAHSTHLDCVAESAGAGATPRFCAVSCPEHGPQGC